MYPVVHRPTILKAYEQYLEVSGALSEVSHEMTQLNLIFAIAALSSGVCCLYMARVVRSVANLLACCSREPIRIPPSLKTTGFLPWRRFPRTFPYQRYSALFLRRFIA